MRVVASKIIFNEKFSLVKLLVVFKKLKKMPIFLGYVQKSLMFLLFNSPFYDIISKMLKFINIIGDHQCQLLLTHLI
jgi:hypothetical protein